MIAPVAAVAAEKKHEEKKEVKAEEKAETSTSTEKKAKRGSVFGGLFGKKDATSPTEEKKESEVAPAVPAKDTTATEVPAVSEEAPKIEKPIEAKPIDTAAVVAAADTVTTPPAVEESPKEATAVPAETTTAGKTEEKGGLFGFIKKQEARFAGKKDSEDETTEHVAATEERPARDKRRSSLFSGLGTLKKKNQSQERSADATETKREKSPMPSKIGGLFRKPSQAVKPTETPKETTAATEAATTSTDVPTTNGATTETAPAATESKIVGDVVPQELSAHDQATIEPTAKTVEATA